MSDIIVTHLSLERGIKKLLQGYMGCLLHSSRYEDTDTTDLCLYVSVCVSDILISFKESWDMMDDLHCRRWEKQSCDYANEADFDAKCPRLDTNVHDSWKGNAPCKK